MEENKKAMKVLTNEKIDLEKENKKLVGRNNKLAGDLADMEKVSFNCRVVRICQLVVMCNKPVRKIN